MCSIGSSPPLFRFLSSRLIPVISNNSETFRETTSPSLKCFFNLPSMDSTEVSTLEPVRPNRVENECENTKENFSMSAHQNRDTHGKGRLKRTT